MTDAPSTPAPAPVPSPSPAPSAPAPEAPAAEPPQAAAAQPAPEAPPAAPAPDPSEPARERERKRLLLHMPVDVRSASLVVLAVLASVFALQWGQAVFIPLMLSLLMTYALSPLVELLHRWHLPRWIGAALILVGLFGGIGWTGYSLSGNASQLLDSLPVAAQKLGLAMRRDKGASATPLESVQAAAAQLEKAAEENSARVASRRGVARVVIERPNFNVRDYLLSGTVGLLSAMGQLTLVAFLTYFALCSGDTFRRKLIKITGSSLQKKKVTVHVLDDITRNIERYLLVQILVSAVVGVATGLAFWALGVENAAVWGIIAAVTNLIPYIGSVIVLAAAGLVAFLQFNSLQMGIVVGGVSLAIHTIIGNLLMPWLTSRTSRMNPVAVFVGVIFWGWLWGIWGLLLGIPITMVIKAICDRVEDLQPIGELLGE
ncbi:MULTISPECIES: AI-2E family transporter [unclassified Variovorax]|jgi:predicted PurR-regulated permease PerM|uniref:AI-2E family transporter n=1 Tax=unclassified Variovorax TaxID=663243 RepID=UPI0008CDE9D5|nr:MULTISPECIES: AI-2E family transporter [unclassified Variovorax]SEJ16229.1 Predicted PurR-regulated permease PerM [Variovorax sp. OK202]SFC06995.1 Predicted PurR-regulated permease PerM [Variovorax sp. OK212]